MAGSGVSGSGGALRARSRLLRFVVLPALLAVSAASALATAAGRPGSGPLTAPGTDRRDRGAVTVPIAARVHVVQPGETIWSIARALRPAGDVRPLVDRLERQLRGHPLLPGQVLVVP